MAEHVAASRGGQAKRPLSKLWLAMLVLGLGAIVAGIVLIAGPLWSVFQRGQADQTALQSWNAGGADSMIGPVKEGKRVATPTTCGSSSSSDYALVTFGAPAQYHYAGVAGDGTWAMLAQRSMVHYHGTPNPGQQGNVIIAFHREPDYQYINQLEPGDTVTIQDRACHSFVYQITNVWDLPPSRVTQLAPTDGYDLTLITCDPWWQDYDRLVWRGTLISPPPGSGASGSFGGASGPAVPGNPSF